MICIAAAFTAMWGAILGAPTLRLRGDYLAIVTLAFGEIVPRVFELSTSGPFGLGNLDISNGRQGITPVDKPWAPIPGLDNITRIDITPSTSSRWGCCCVVLFVNIRLRDSRLGRAWIAVREDEVAAAAMGVHLVRVKLWAYAIGASIGGFAGVFLGVFQNTINVDQFEFGFSVFILCMIILGGMGNLAGVILGAVALSMINRFLLPELNTVPEKFGLDFDVTAISFGIFGFLLLVMMVLRPEGFIPNRRRKIELHEDAFDDALIEVQGAVSDPQRQRPRGHGHHQALRRPRGGQRRRLRRPAQVDRRDHRAQRRRQDDVLQLHDRPLQADHRHGHVRRPRHHRQGAAHRHPGGHRAHVPEHQAVQDHDRARERHGRPATAACRRGITGLDPPHAVRAPRGARDGGGRRELLKLVGIPRRHQTSRPACPTATSGGSRSPARSRRTRSCCCSTSRPPA